MLLAPPVASIVNCNQEEKKEKNKNAEQQHPLALDRRNRSVRPRWLTETPVRELASVRPAAIEGDFV